MTNVKALETLFSSSFRVIKFSSVKWKNNNNERLLYTIKPSKFSSALISFAVFTEKKVIQKMTALQYHCQTVWLFRSQMGAEDSRERMISNEFRLILIATCYMIMVFVSSGVYSLKHPLEHQITLTMIQRWIRFAHMKTLFKWILCAVQLQKRTWGYVKRNFLVEKYRRWYHSSPFETNL